jgi:parallel beta-helix repeat protein
MRHYFIKNIFCMTLSMAICSDASAMTFQKPLLVNNTYIKEHGRVIIGNFTGTTTTPAIAIVTSTPVIIRDSNLQGPGDLIYVQGGDVTVVNTTGVATNPNVSGVQKGMFIHADYARNLRVENCTMQGVRYGIYVNSYSGNKTEKNSISLLHNSMINIDGRPSDGNNGYLTAGDYIAHGIELNAVSNVPNIEIAWNQVLNQPSVSQASDLIGIYESSGTSSSPISVHDNYLQGAYPVNPGGTTLYYGGGISLDGSAVTTADNTVAFTLVYNNHIVSTADYGIQIKAGHDNTVYHNRIISSGKLTTGTVYAMPYAVGLWNINFYNQVGTIFYNNIMHDNTSGVIANNGAGLPVRADMLLPGQNNAIDNNVSFQPVANTAPTTTDEANEYALWQKSFVSHH